MKLVQAISGEMIEAIDRAALSFVATVNGDGSANLAPIASLCVHDGALMFANMAAATTVANLRRDPRITAVVVDIFRRRGFRFTGMATVWAPGTAAYDIGAERVWATNGRIYPVHEVVTVAVDRAAPILSPAYRFGEDPSEERIEAAFLRRYGVQRSRTGSTPAQEITDRGG